jgi:hypothetical protein
LALLSDAAYVAGMQKIESALVQAEARGETILFQTDIPISMLTGHRTKVTVQPPAGFMLGE